MRFFQQRIFLNKIFCIITTRVRKIFAIKSLQESIMYIFGEQKGTFVNGNSILAGKDMEIFSGDRILFADVGYECYNSL